MMDNIDKKTFKLVLYIIGQIYDIPNPLVSFPCPYKVGRYSVAAREVLECNIDEEGKCQHFESCKSNSGKDDMDIVIECWVKLLEEEGVDRL